MRLERHKNGLLGPQTTTELNNDKSKALEDMGNNTTEESSMMDDSRSCRSRVREKVEVGRENSLCGSSIRKHLKRN